MDGDDYEHAEVGAEKAKQRAESVPKLADDDAAADGGRDFGRDVVFDQSGASGVSPTCIKRGPKDEDVAPVLEQVGAIRVVRSEKLGGEGHESDGKQECQVNPGEADIGTA